MSATERIRGEIREIGLVTLFFLVCFLFFLSIKKLLLDEYEIELAILGTAVIGALVVAKVVLILGKTRYGNRFESERLIVHVIWRSLVYTAIVCAVTHAERLFELYRQLGDLPAALAGLWGGEDVYQFVAMNLGVGVSLLLYNFFSEIDRHLGEGVLRKLFFARRGDAGVQ